jgi:hypothetical protein
MIYLTSFAKSKHLPDTIERWSAAVYQPKGFSYPKAEWADIRDETGDWIRPRRFVDEPSPRLAYRQALLDHYEARRDEAMAWLADKNDVALLCWCPYERAAVRQMKDWGSFICHTSVLGEFAATLDNTQPVWFDSDRLAMTVLTQRSLARP